MKIKIDKLDALFSKYIKLKAGGRCEFCGECPKPRAYHCHHGVAGRRYLNTRWEEDNCAALDFTCHNLLEDFPSINQDFFKKRIGTKRMEELEVIARTYNKMTMERKEAIKVSLEEKIKLLEGENHA